MIMFHSLIKRVFALFTAAVFMVASVSPAFAQSQLMPQTPIISKAVFTPVMMQGVRIYPDDPLRFDFIIEPGQDYLSSGEMKEESYKLIKYFLASLTVPERDLWVNLSPYEKDRIIPESFSTTEMGRDLLAQDYMLKQITASLMYPEAELGEEFWNRIYDKAQSRFGTTDIPVNTFNKVWIVPEKAVVYENGDTVLVSESRLKVLLENDYLALNEHSYEGSNADLGSMAVDVGTQEIIREIVIPELEYLVNNSEQFANLRQIYRGVILATWFKQHLRESVLGKVYMDQNKVDGIDSVSPSEKQDIYQQYVSAYEQGVYDFIREEYDVNTQQVVPRKYFSGGADFAMMGTLERETATVPVVSDAAMIAQVELDPRFQEMSFTQALGWRLYDRMLADFDEAEAVRMLGLYADRLRGENIADRINRVDFEDFEQLIADARDDIERLGNRDTLRTGNVEQDEAGLLDVINNVSARIGIKQQRDAQIAEFVSSEESMPPADVLRGQAVILRGAGAVGFELAKALRRSGARLLIFEVASQANNIAKIREEFADDIAAGEVGLFLEEDYGSGQTSRFYVNPFENENIAEYLADNMDITPESGIQGLIAASRFHSVRAQDVPRFKAAGIEWMSFVENDVYFGNKSAASQAVRDAGIYATQDFEANSGGVRGAMKGTVKIDVSDGFIKRDIVDIARTNIEAQERTGKNGHDLSLERVSNVVLGWEEQGIIYDGKMTFEESQADLEDVRQGFIRLKETDPDATMYDYLMTQPENNFRNPKRLDGVVLPNGVRVKVIAYEEDLPDNDEVRNAWEDHYALYIFEHPDGKRSALAQHKLIELDSEVPQLDGKYYTVGGSRIDSFNSEADLMRVVLEFSREMTKKNAGAGVPAGGSKNGLDVSGSGLTADSREVPASQVDARNQFLINDAQANAYVAIALGETGALLAQDAGLSPDDVILRYEQGGVTYDRNGISITLDKGFSAPHTARNYNPEFGKDPGPYTVKTTYAATVATAILAAGARQTQQADFAELSTPVGGIDFNPANFALESQGVGMTVDFDIDPAVFNGRMPSGFVPVIFDMLPVLQFPGIVGTEPRTGSMEVSYR